MGTAKQEVKTLLGSLPDDGSLEDIKYHLYVIEKIRHGLDAAATLGTVAQHEAERRLDKWIAK